MQSLSILWSGVALLSWYAIVRYLTSDHRVALVATFLLATEQQFVITSATGRMDMTCAALGLS